MRARRTHIQLLIVSLLSFVCHGSTVNIYGGSFDLPIPADTSQNRGWMDDAVIDIEESFVITDIDVAIDIEHTNIFDLDIFLVGPGGQHLTLNTYDTNDFVKAANYADTIFDDEALIHIEDGSYPFTGSFQPRAGNLLSVFDGTDAIGRWRLRVEDKYHNDRGVLNKFQLLITTPEPATLFLLGAGLLKVRRKYRL